MLRIIGQISVYGTKASVERCASIAAIPEGVIKQMGLMRKVPEANSWSYESPLYRFHLDVIDKEIQDFIAAHGQLGNALAEDDPGITYAFFTLCPVDQSYEENFACVFSRETLHSLSCLGLALQIAPASVMPEAPYWV